jgi:uncharacterized membrane protein
MSNRSRKNRQIANSGDENQVPTPRIELLAAFRQSPFPPPAELEKYEALYPGITKQFFDNFEKQTSHRMELEKIVIQGDNKRANTGQHYSFFITLAFLILAGFLFFTGRNAIAIGLAITSITPIIISFIRSSQKRKEERENKRREMGMV